MKITKKMMNTYLNYCRYQKKLSPQTLKAYQIDLMQFFTFAASADQQLNRTNLSNYMTALHKKYRPKSVKRKLTSLKAFCNYLVYEDILDETNAGSVCGGCIERVEEILDRLTVRQ